MSKWNKFDDSFDELLHWSASMTNFKPTNRAVVLLFKGFGALCVALGMVGVIVPGLPTVPFLLLAIWAFSKGSPELAEKVRNGKRFGPLIRDWEQNRVIPVRAKIIAILMMMASFAWAVHAKTPTIMLIIVSAILLCAATFILTRKSR